MMKLGIFSKTFNRPTVEDNFEAVRAHGLSCVQFNMSCVGLPSLPDAIDTATRSRIHEAAARSGIVIEAVSGTFNMIHPDPAVREQGLRRLRTLAAACRDMGASVVTLCTGTRDAADMWRWHADNALPKAWSDLLRAMEAALTIAEDEQVTLAFEPERANVVNSAERGRALLDAMQSPRLKVIIDPANIIIPGDAQEMERVVERAFDLLCEHIIIAHAKDRGADDEFRAAGQGVLNYDHYLRLLQERAFAGPLIVHGLAETQVAASLQFLRDILQRK
jgi:sugar phosphate isomerase/epimerase